MFNWRDYLVPGKIDAIDIAAFMVGFLVVILLFTSCT